MAVELTDLDQLDTDEVQQNLEEVKALVQEQHPELYVRRGALHDILLLKHAELATLNQANIERWRKSSTLLGISEDPTLADDDIVDVALSRYNLTRKDGLPAGGEVAIVVSDNTTVTIAAGAIFEAQGQQFSSDAAYVAKAEEAQINLETDRLLTELDDGNFAFTINVTALEDGVAGQLSKDTALVPLSLPNNFVEAYATSDFTGGRDLETNAELVERQQEGIAAEALSGRLNMQATLLEREEFQDIVTQSIVGLGDAEMLRDRHTIFPTSIGGRVDWYIRTQERLLHTSLTKTATLVSKDGADGTWQFTIVRDDYPGFYEVRSIRLPDDADTDGTFTIVSDTRGLDLSGTGWRPDVANATEGAYSAYQTAVIQFTDDETDATELAIGATADYSVEVVGMPLIEDLQDLIGGHDTRNTAADALVKAPVPCFVQLSFTIHSKSTDEAPDEDAIKEDLCQEINQVDFLGVLFAAQLQHRIQTRLTGAAAAGDIDIFGRIRTPAGDTLYLRSSEVIEVQDDADAMVTTKTVQFFCEPSDIGITVVQDLPVPV